MDIIRAKKQDIGELSSLIAERFQNDPKSALELEGLDKKIDILKGVTSIQLEMYLKYGEVYMTENKKGVIYYHFKSRFGLLRIIKMFFKLLRFFGKSLSRSERKRLTANTKKLGKLSHISWRDKISDGDYCYISLLCTAGDMKGSGAFRGLIEKALEQSENLGVPVLLDTNNPNNIPLYGHFGFKMYTEYKGNPEYGINQYCMYKK